MKRIGLLVLVGVWAVLGFAQECVVDSVQMDLRTAFERVAALEGFEALFAERCGRHHRIPVGQVRGHSPRQRQPSRRSAPNFFRTASRCALQRRSDQQKQNHPLLYHHR